MEEIWLIFLFQANLLLLVQSLSVNDTESRFVLSLLDPDVYDRTERPFKTQNEPVTVEVGVYFNNIADISEISMDISVSMFLRQMWTDPRLQFEDHAHFKDTITLHESMRDKLWLPDIYLRNEIVNGQVHELATPNVMITLTPSGYIFYSQRITTKLLCIMSLHNFPMDRQNCSLEIEPYSHSTKEVKLQWKENSVSKRDSIELPEFNLSSISLGDCTSYYTVGNSSGSWSCIYVTLHLERLFNYYVIQVFAPSIMVVILSWVSFWIDIHAVPARITLGLLTVLTITTQASGVSNKLPKVSYIKGIDIWMFTCTVFVFAGLIEYSAVNVLSRRTNEMDNQTQSQVTSTTKEQTNENGCYGGVTSNSVKTTTSPYSKSHSVDCGRNVLSGCFCRRRENKRTNKALRVDIVSRIMFPATFICFNLFYWIYYFKGILFD